MIIYCATDDGVELQTVTMLRYKWHCVNDAACLCTRDGILLSEGHSVGSK